VIFRPSACVVAFDGALDLFPRAACLAASPWVPVPLPLRALVGMSSQPVDVGWSVMGCLSPLAAWPPPLHFPSHDALLFVASPLVPGTARPPLVPAAISTLVLWRLPFRPLSVATLLSFGAPGCILSPRFASPVQCCSARILALSQWPAVLICGGAPAVSFPVFLLFPGSLSGRDFRFRGAIAVATSYTAA